MTDFASNLIRLSADLVGAYVFKNHVAAEYLPGVIASIHATLVANDSGTTGEQTTALIPTVPVKKSITPDRIVCLEDGRAFKSLKRHLRTAYDISPDECRAKWGLPADFPMVAPNSAAARSGTQKR
jgi:predicted transcriptional regulator